MENSNDVAAAAATSATTASPAVVAEDGDSTAVAAQEVVSSTTQAVEPTKRSLRVQTWRKIQDNKCGTGFNAVFNRIPGFVDSDKAAVLLSETEEFKKAEHIKVNIDRALHAVKLQTLIAGKTLYLPGTRESCALHLRVDVPADATEDQKKEILHVQDVQHRTEITLDNKDKLDMVVIGSVVVARDGYRIGRGNGFADLDIGLLIEIGVITPDTVIATVVHDMQVVDSLPINLFQKHDTPVDLIVTGTEVIRVANRLPRPTGLFWELLSQRRLKIIPVLQTLQEIQTKEGKVITLKDEDTDVEQNQNNKNRRRGFFRRRVGRRNQRRATSQTDTEHQGAENTQQKRNPRRNRRFTNNRRRRPTKSEGDQSGVEAKSQDRKSGGEKKQRQRKNRPTNDFCIKLSNISRDVRVKDLKTELRKRECNPFHISWKGQFGKCYLHFGNRNGNPSSEDEINKVLNSLSNLSLTVTTGGENAIGAEGDGAPTAIQPQQTKTVNVSVELIKFDAKSVDSKQPGVWKKSGDVDKAVTLFSETEEFLKAEHIQVNNDITLYAMQLQTLLAGKTLYLPRPCESRAAYSKVDVPADATAEQKKQIIQDVQQHSAEISIDNKVSLDMVVIDSVQVSRKGLRIGSANYMSDVHIAFLIEIGAITPDTTIVTMVNNSQLCECLPENPLQKYYTPVDLIVTPKEIVRIDNRLQRLNGIFWEQLTEQDFKIMPVLEALKGILGEASQTISLKGENNECDVAGELDVGATGGIDVAAGGDGDATRIKFVDPAAV